MEQWRKDARKEAIIIDIDSLVPADHQLVKKLPKRPHFLYNRGNGGVFMEQWRKDARKEAIIIDIDSLVPADHLLRRIEKVMDYEWLYERLDRKSHGLRVAV